MTILTIESIRMQSWSRWRKTGSHLIGQIAQRYTQEGLIRMLFWILVKSIKKIISLFYRNVEFDLWAIELDRINDYENKSGDNYYCKYLREEDLLAIEKRFGKSVSEDFATRIRTATCYLILEGDEIIGYSWSCSHKIKKEGFPPFLFDINPGNSMVYLYDDFVIPEKRGKGANRKLTHYRFSEVKKAGFKKGFGLIEKHNLPQIKIIKGSGFEVMGRIVHRRYLWHVVEDKSALEKLCKSN